MNFKYEPNRIFTETNDGTLLAEITFPLVGENTVDWNHTFVDSSLRGQGVAGQLADAAVKQIRSKGWQTLATCSYAKKWFEDHPDQAGLLKTR